MRHDLLVVVSVSSMFVLTGCATVSPISTISPAVLVLAADATESAASHSITAIPDEHYPAHLLAAGDPQASVPQVATRHPVMPTATPLPPTLPPATSTAAPTPSESIGPAIPARLLIPAINLDVPIVAVGWSVIEKDGQQVSEWDVPNWRAAGWLNTSALVGTPGNTVLEGHQDIDGRVFENLEYLKVGDEVQVQTDSQIYRYVVTVRMIVPEKDQPLEVRRDNARWIGPSDDERLTLVTCWPRNDNTHRLILVALPALH